MEPLVSEKSTKAEILKAYDEMLKKITENKTEDPKKNLEEQKKQVLVKQAQEVNEEGIVKTLAGLKIEIGSSLDKLAEKLLAEYKKLSDLTQAINIEKDNLQNLYQVSMNADSLAALILAQKEKKAQFERELEEKQQSFDEKIKIGLLNHETEMKQKRDEWIKEKTRVELEIKELIDETKKKRAREEEEYMYNLKTIRKKDQDEYKEKSEKLEKELISRKTSFEAEISEREKAVSAAEKELNELRLKVTGFPKEIEKAILDTTTRITEKLMSEHKYQSDLLAKHNEGELKLKDQTISTLLSKIKDLETNIKELNQKALVAEAGVKDIAMKAIESSSKVQIIEKTKDGN